MTTGISTPRDMRIDFDELKRIVDERGPHKENFLKSKRCKILVAVSVLLASAVVALMATTYAIAATATTKVTTTPSPTTSTVGVPTFQIITRMNDPTTAIWNAAAGSMSQNSIAGTGVGDYASGQGSAQCVDFADTTYLNYGNVGLNLTSTTSTAGVGTGLFTTPQIGASIVQSIQFQAGNDSINRDPLNITLEGSNATGTNLYFGSFWTLLYAGPTGLAPFTATRLAWGDLQNFTNTLPFTSYRMLVTDQRGADYGTEFAEMHLYGIV